MSSDMRLYETFYGIDVTDWQVNFGIFTGHHKLLVKEYISEGARTVDESTATETHSFIYPNHLAKTYFIEGVIDGQVTFIASGATTYLYQYKVTVCKVHEDGTDTELFTSNWVDVNITLIWDTSIVTAGVGDEIVCPFWIDAWEYAELSEQERIYVKVESTCTDTTPSSCTNLVLSHTNDSEWEDLKITIPFMGV
jgi:hypothetical protein